MRTRIIICALALVAVGAVASLSVGASASNRDRRVRLSVISHPPKVVPLPLALLHSTWGAAFAVPSGVPAGRLGGYRFYVVPGKDAMVCLVGINRRSESTGICNEAAGLAHGAFLAAHLRDDGRAEIAGMLPDGFGTVTAGGRTTRVNRNVFLLRTRPVSQLRARGPAGTRTIQAKSLFAGQ
jgi:hypothetical protein